MSADSQLQALIGRIRELGDLPEKAAPDVAIALREVITGNIAAQRGPDGKAWLATQSGDPALANAATELTVEANGTRITAKLTGNAARHHLGRAKGYRKNGIERRILPSRRTPQPMIEAIRLALKRRFQGIFNG